MNKKSLIAASLVTGVTAVSLTGTGLVSAATDTTGGQGDLVTKISQKFHLNKSDVQKVFDEDHAAHEANMQKHEQERLDQAVKDGKITADQETMILAKLKEMRADRQANKDEMQNLTEDQRHAKMEAKRTELEKWATDNNIPLEYLHPMGGHEGRMGPRRS